MHVWSMDFFFVLKSLNAHRSLIYSGYRTCGYTHINFFCFFFSCLFFFSSFLLDFSSFPSISQAHTFIEVFDKGVRRVQITNFRIYSIFISSVLCTVKWSDLSKQTEKKCFSSRAIDSLKKHFVNIVFEMIFFPLLLYWVIDFFLRLHLNCNFFGRFTTSFYRL